MGKLNKIKKTIERWHAMNSDKIPQLIRTDALGSWNGEIKVDNTPMVYTSAPGLRHSFYTPNERYRDALVKLDIPKEWYKEHKVLNPSYNTGADFVDKSAGYESNKMGRKYFDSDRGGRTSVFDESIPNDFIKEICFGEKADKCFSPDELLKYTVNESSNPDKSPWRWEWRSRGFIK